MSNRFGFILVKPQIGENIGASARAIKNFGFSKLIIVSPKQTWPNAKAKATSVGAYDILQKSKIFSKTSEAIKNFDVIFSLSARKRDINKKHISFNQFHNIINTNNKTKFGFMFGPEASGLSNEDLSYSNYVLQIPTSKNFKSINLSHSLTIIAYEIFKSLNQKIFTKMSKNINISSKKKIKVLIEHLTNLLDKKDFFYS
ncbi:RNA methyltransferase [Pelagibacteraceae bacterium]|nr:RNA methyltransferase [Pelagibacteraceae bacterium]